ncbi:type II toxin-antitoxin system prevent-host-death family antitoxin [Pseudomonas silvicola]|nr:type II toxin-antitoxin system prevent-host-death family antitoxin [Pseudomonas silvicola]
MHVLTFSQARAGLKQTMDDVCRDHEPAIVTRQRGEPVVILSLEDYNAMEETLYLLGTQENSKRLRESIALHKAGKAFTKEISLDVAEQEAAEQD